jgi:hypothetical protein
MSRWLVPFLLLVVSARPNQQACPVAACRSCLNRCWDASAPSKPIVTALSRALTAAAPSGGSGVCATADATAEFLRAVRRVVREHASAISVADGVWGLGLHGASGDFWAGFYACPQSRSTPGGCSRASTRAGHGLLLLECPGRRVCRWDAETLDYAHATDSVATCLGIGRGRRALAAVPQAESGGSPTNSSDASKRARRALVEQPLATATGRPRQWDCAARALARAPPARRATGGWTIYPQRTTRRTTYARFEPTQLVRLLSDAAFAGGVRPTRVADLTPVTVYAVADLLQDSCFGAHRRGGRGASQCRAACALCRDEPELLHTDACANSTAAGGPAPQRSSVATTAATQLGRLERSTGVRRGAARLATLTRSLSEHILSVIVGGR